MTLVIHALLAAVIILTSIVGAAPSPPSLMPNTTHSYPSDHELLQKRKHYEWCKSSFDQCTKWQAWFQQIAQDNLGRMKRLETDTQKAVAQWKSCHPGVELPTPSNAPHPKIAARQGLGNLGGIGDIIPGFNAYVGMNHAVGDIFDRISEALNPRPRNCNQTEQCLAQTRQIELIVHEQFVNLTQAEQNMENYAIQSSQCVDEQNAALEVGLNPFAKSRLRARNDEEETKIELSTNREMCEALRDKVRLHEANEQGRFDDFEGKITSGMTGVKPPPPRPCRRDTQSLHKREKHYPEDNDDMRTIIGSCRSHILTYLQYAEKYNEWTQRRHFETMEPKFYQMHGPHFFPLMNATTPACSDTVPPVPSVPKPATAVSPAALPPPPNPVTAVEPLPSLPTVNPVAGLPPLPSLPPAGLSGRSASKNVVKRDHLDLETVHEIKEFRDYLNGMTDTLLGQLKQCRTDKAELMDKYWIYYYSKLNEETYDTKKETTVTATLISTATGAASTATVTSIVTSTVTETASSIDRPSSTSSPAAASSPQKALAPSSVQAAITITAEPSSTQSPTTADGPATVTVTAAAASSSAQSSSTSSVPVEPSVVTIPASVVTLSPSLKTAEPSTLPQSSTTSVARLTVTV